MRPQLVACDAELWTKSIQERSATVRFPFRAPPAVRTRADRPHRAPSTVASSALSGVKVVRAFNSRYGAFWVIHRSPGDTFGGGTTTDLLFHRSTGCMPFPNISSSEARAYVPAQKWNNNGRVIVRAEKMQKRSCAVTAQTLKLRLSVCSRRHVLPRLPTESDPALNE